MSDKEAYADYYEAVQRNGFVIGNVPERLIDEALCLAAMRSDVGAFLHTPEQFRTERICLVAVREVGIMLRGVPKQHRSVCGAYLKLIGASA